jgi:hypothetical protein
LVEAFVFLLVGILVSPGLVIVAWKGRE